MVRLVEVDEIPTAAKKGARLVLVEEEPAKPFGQRLNEGIADVPRQLGLTARAGLEGLGSIADMVATPARVALNLLPGVDIQPGMGRNAANMLGLPQPRDATERIVGNAASALASGALPIAAGANLARNTSGIAQGVGKMLAANPAQQLASAGAAGAAGGYTRETGGNEGSQLAASLAAGVATPFAMAGAQKLGQGAARLAAAAGRAAPQPMQVDVTINNALQYSGMTLDQLPADVARGIRNDVAAALKVSDNLSPDAVRRLADYRLTGLTPTRAKLTQDVGDITRQENLSHLGANSSDRSAQQLAQTTNLNNRALTAGLNKLGAGGADDQIGAAGKIMGALEQRNAKAQQLIGDRYAAARGTDGRAAQLDPSAFTQRANDLLDEALLGGKLPADVRNLLNQTATGKMPLTVDVAEQLKTRIGDLQRATFDRAEKKALGLVRGALEETPLLPGQQVGQQSIDAFNSARSLNRKWMQIVERTPALQAVRDGIEPDKFVQQYIIGNGAKSNVMDVAQLKGSIKSSPEAMQAVREQILAHIKNKAINGAADETANFSQSAYNKALNAIGERKLKLFFGAEDINQMKALGRVAAYEQFQPAGSAVNNSKTAGASVSAILDRIGGKLKEVPFLGPNIQPALQNISVRMQAGQAMNAPRALIGGPGSQVLPAPSRAPWMISPAAFMSPDEEEQRRRQGGLLFP